MWKIFNFNGLRALNVDQWTNIGLLCSPSRLIPSNLAALSVLVVFQGQKHSFNICCFKQYLKMTGLRAAYSGNIPSNTLWNDLFHCLIFLSDWGPKCCSLRFPINVYLLPAYSNAVRLRVDATDSLKFGSQTCQLKCRYT